MLAHPQIALVCSQYAAPSFPRRIAEVYSASLSGDLHNPTLGINVGSPFKTVEINLTDSQFVVEHLCGRR